jgi:hypothetical protein
MERRFQAIPPLCTDYDVLTEIGNLEKVLPQITRIHVKSHQVFTNPKPLPVLINELCDQSATEAQFKQPSEIWFPTGKAH